MLGDTSTHFHPTGFQIQFYQNEIHRPTKAEVGALCKARITSLSLSLSTGPKIHFNKTEIHHRTGVELGVEALCKAWGTTHLISLSLKIYIREL